MVVERARWMDSREFKRVSREGEGVRDRKGGGVCAVVAVADRGVAMEVVAGVVVEDVEIETVGRTGAETCREEAAHVGFTNMLSPLLAAMVVVVVVVGIGVSDTERWGTAPDTEGVWSRGEVDTGLRLLISMTSDALSSFMRSL